MFINYEGLIPIIGIITLLLMAYAIIPASKDPIKNKEWIKTWKPKIKWLAPLVILFGILELFNVF